MAPEDKVDETDAKVLGIKWNDVNDTLQLGVSMIFEQAEKLSPTKRNILKIIASVYDPVGYLAPIVVNLKLLFQHFLLLHLPFIYLFLRS